MSATMDQKAYLQKYLGGPSKDKKKRKKKAVKGKGFKIIDDDIDLTKLRPLDGDELDLFDEGEDAPQIAGIIDERPEDIKKLEQFKTTTKWKVVNQDDGFNSKLEIQELKQDIKEIEKENELIFGKMYSDSEDENKNDKDLSPPRKASKISKDIHSKKHDNSPKTKRKENISLSPIKKKQIDSDASPPRKSSKGDKQNSSKKHGSDSDFSPPRKRDKLMSQSPLKKQHNSSDSDLSPPRKLDTRPKNKPRKTSRWGYFENEKESDHPRSGKNLDSSTHKSRNKQSDSDESPARKTRRENDDQKDRNVKGSKRNESIDSDISPPRRKKLSPPKYYTKNEPRNNSYTKDRKSMSPDKSNKRRNELDHSYRNRPKSPNQRHKYSDKDDNSKERYRRYESNQRRTNVNDSTRNNRYKDSNEGKLVHRSRSPKRCKGQSDSDQSPPRRKENKNRPDKRRGKDIDSDQSPKGKVIKNRSPDKKRSKQSDSDQSPPRRKESGRRNENYRKESESPPPSNKKMAKTLEGKKAGLQDARQLREENEQFRRKEDEIFNKMADEVSGRNAQAVSRRSKRETSEERRKQKDKAERQKELDAKYQKWSRGLKQIEDQEARVQDFLHEAAKPLARFKNDRDLENSLRDVERDGDPMLKYIRERKRERGELPPEKPSYKGSFPPNRFNIRPGYRWDGVDRSNGYEKKYFEQQSKRKAQEEEAYKWSTEDL